MQILADILSSLMSSDNIKSLVKTFAYSNKIRSPPDMF